MVSKPRKSTTSNENHNLLSKADIAEMLNMSSQLLANKASRAAERGEDFPQPTYSNHSGTVTLYTLDDAKKVYEYVTKAERERLAKAEAAFAQFGLTTTDGTPVEEPKLEIPEEKAPEPAKAPEKPEPKAEAKPAAKAEAKPAAKAETSVKAATKPATVSDSKAPEFKAADAKTAPAAPATAPKTGTAQNKGGTPAKVVGTGAAFGLK